MNSHQEQIIVDIIFYYWVVGNTQKQIAEDLTWMHGINMHQMQLSQMLRDYNFSAENGRNRGKLNYLRHRMPDEQIKSYLHDIIFSQRLRNIEDFQAVFERTNLASNSSQPIKSSARGSYNNTASIISLILIFIITFIFLNIFTPFWWWVKFIIAFFASAFISVILEELFFKIRQ